MENVGLSNCPRYSCGYLFYNLNFSAIYISEVTQVFCLTAFIYLQFIYKMLREQLNDLRGFLINTA